MLHFFVIQEVLIWTTNMLKDVGDNPSTEKVREYVWNTLSGGVSTMQGFLPLYFLVDGHWLFTLLIMSKKTIKMGDCLI